MSRAQLLGASWRRLGPRVYVWHELADDPLIRLKAALLRLPDNAVFSGRTAAWLHGLDSQLPSAIEATLSPPGTTAHLAGITIRRSRLATDEVVVRRGFRATSLLRTAVDIACRTDLVEAVVVLDAAMHRGLRKDASINWVDAHRGHRGVRKLREAIELAEPLTESPMETRLRMALVLAGLPRPQVQVTLRDASGAFLARPDLLYPGLVIEYDGATHRDSLASDNRRQNRLINAGYRLLRFTAADLENAPSIVRQALGHEPLG